MAESGSPPETLSQLIAARAERSPESTAFWFDGTSWSCRDLDQTSRRLAQGLVEAGIGPGDRVAFWMPNLTTYLALFFACARLGAIAVAVNTRFRATEVGDIISRSGAKALAFAPAFLGIDFPAILDAVAPDYLKALTAVIAASAGRAAAASIPAISTLPPGIRRLSVTELAERPAFDQEWGRPDSGVAIFTTSGTTRAPKFVLHGQAGIARHGGDVARRLGFSEPGTASLQALPLCGVFGFAQAIATLAAGRPMALMPSFDATEAVRLIARHRLTHAVGSDEMFDRMLDKADSGDLASLRWVGYASFAQGIRADLAQRLDRQGTRLVGLYGMSELLALYASQRPDDPLDARARPGGYPVAADAAIRVVDPATGTIKPAGEAGMLELKGPSAMLGYFGDDDATRATLTPDGYVRTGDLGYGTGDGGFVFLARMGDALRLGGFLVSPREIESFLEEQPPVAQAQVVDIPGAGGTAPFAFVVMKAGFKLDQAALISRCRAHLARYKVPVRIIALDAFPVTTGPNGTKIQRNRLRDMAAEIMGSDAATREP